MKIDELRKIIYEEVQKAIRVELREMLTEMQTQPSIVSKPITKPHYNEVTRKVENVQEPFSISDMLKETMSSMTREDYHGIMGETVVQSSNPTIAESIENDMSGLPSFVKNAKAVLDASINKDKERHGV